MKEENNRIVGIAEIFDAKVKVNMITIGYSLNEKYRGRGIATKAVSAMLDFLFNEIDVNRVQAFVKPENVKSGSVLQRNHFTKEGIIRQGDYWTDDGIVDLDLYSMLKQEYH